MYSLRDRGAYRKLDSLTPDISRWESEGGAVLPAGVDCGGPPTVARATWAALSSHGYATWGAHLTLAAAFLLIVIVTLI
jgi:hypothetical protein